MNILLVSNKLFHYRIPIYNYFSKRFKENGFEFIVLASEVQEDNPNEIEFQLKIISPNLGKYLSYIKEINPVTILYFLHLRDWIGWPLLLWSWRQKIPSIYWNHGVNLQDPENKIKNICYHLFHTFSDAILLYSDNERKYIKTSNHQKIFIAPNSLNDMSFPEILKSKEELKQENNLSGCKIVLFVSRISSRKRLPDLIAASKLLNSNIKVVIVGPGLDNNLLKEIKKTSTIEYWGAIYDSFKINEVFKMSDLFCIPGLIGLSINQASYWGLPTITEVGNHSPEIVYLRQEESGFVVPQGDVVQLADKINYILSNEEIYSSFSRAAKNIISSEASIEKMFEGFWESIRYVLDIRDSINVA